MMCREMDSLMDSNSSAMSGAREARGSAVSLPGGNGCGEERELVVVAPVFLDGAATSIDAGGCGCGSEHPDGPVPPSPPSADVRTATMASASAADSTYVRRQAASYSNLKELDAGPS